jgi:hypothetical protein
MRRYLVDTHHTDDYDPSGALRGPPFGVGLPFVRKESRT